MAGSLWSQRETALDRLDTTMTSPVEWGAARRLDNAYIAAVRNRREHKQDPHRADVVVPQVPTDSAQLAFLAQVSTFDPLTGGQAYYVVAVERDGTGFWKLAFVTRAGSTLQALTHSSGATPAVTPEAFARITQLAANSVQDSMTHKTLTFRTRDGATAHRRFTVNSANEGVFGLTLPSGDVLSCFTLHTLDTYTGGSGLLQGSTRARWGFQLAPGTYASITTDTAAPMCVQGKGVGASQGVVRFSSPARVVAVRGVRR
jgi:hypothetical protein